MVKKSYAQFRGKPYNNNKPDYSLIAPLPNPNPNLKPRQKLNPKFTRRYRGNRYNGGKTRKTRK